MCALLAGCVIAVLFAVALTVDFEPAVCLFKHGSVLGSVAFYSALGVSAAVIALAFLLIPRETAEESVFPEENRYSHYYTAEQPFLKILRYFTAFVLLSQGAVKTVFYLIGAESVALPAVAAALMMLALIPLAMYFVPELTERLAPLDGKLHLIFGCVGLINPMLGIMNGYFDKTYSLASQYKTLEHLCLVSIMLAVVYEIRYRMDGTKIRARIASALLAFVLCFGFGFGRLVMLVTLGAVGYADTATTFTLLAVSIYFGARMFFYEED